MPGRSFFITSKRPDDLLVLLPVVLSVMYFSFRKKTQGFVLLVFSISDHEIKAGCRPQPKEPQSPPGISTLETVPSLLCSSTNFLVFSDRFPGVRYQFYFLVNTFIPPPEINSTTIPPALSGSTGD
jgi:hypothetical protein